MSTEFLPGMVVVDVEVTADTPFEDITTGTIIDHTPGALTPPDFDTVLVRWGRSLLSWEYTENLKLVADLYR